MDGRNPASPWMVETLQIQGKTTYQLMQDFFHPTVSWKNPTNSHEIPVISYYYYYDYDDDDDYYYIYIYINPMKTSLMFMLKSCEKSSFFPCQRGSRGGFWEGGPPGPGVVGGMQDQEAVAINGHNKLLHIWVNYNDLTVTSLESWLVREIIPKWP